MSILAQLPLGLVVHKSLGPINRDGGQKSGCCLTRNLLGTQWYASDFYCPQSVVDVNTWTAHFGPFPNEADARRALNAMDLADLDTSGTTGITAWLNLPI